MSDKFPRINHVPFSPNICCDDKVMKSSESFLNKELVITEKLDGTNACLTCSGVFARSHGNTTSHPSFSVIKSIWASIQKDIPEEWSIYGENLFAKHSIHYKALPAFFMVFGIKDESLDNLCDKWLDWETVCGFSDFIRLKTVPELWHGEVTSEQDLKDTIEFVTRVGSFCGGDAIEGCVVRQVKGFSTDDFPNSIGKWVRAGHVQSKDHWTDQKLILNELEKL